MADEETSLGYSFQPGNEKKLRQGLNKSSLGPRADEALKIISLRLPQFLGGNPLGARELLTPKPGGAPPLPQHPGMPGLPGGGTGGPMDPGGSGAGGPWKPGVPTTPRIPPVNSPSGQPPFGPPIPFDNPMPDPGAGGMPTIGRPGVPTFDPGGQDPGMGKPSDPGYAPPPRPRLPRVPHSGGSGSGGGMDLASLLSAMLE